MDFYLTDVISDISFAPTVYWCKTEYHTFKIMILKDNLKTVKIHCCIYVSDENGLREIFAKTRNYTKRYMDFHFTIELINKIPYVIFRNLIYIENGILKLAEKNQSRQSWRYVGDFNTSLSNVLNENNNGNVAS
jgi:hypothetical protein